VAAPFFQVLSKDRRNREALCLFGWISLTAGKAREKKSLQLFDQAIKLEQADQAPKSISVRFVVSNEVNDWGFNIVFVQALLGRAAYHEKSKDFSSALEDLNQIIVAYP
jgi:hypothetical protein